MVDDSKIALIASSVLGVFLDENIRHHKVVSVTRVFGISSIV